MQSWLASLLYGVVDDLFGSNGLRFLMGATTAGIMAVAWRLSRPAESLLPRLALGGVVVGVGASLWSERPLLLGLLALGLTVLAAEDGLDPRWLVPIGWLWVNSHGSFPLGLAYLVAVWVGCRLDGAPTELARRCLRWLGIGVLAGAINPLGPRLLLFPIELLQRQDVLRVVTEWQSPNFVQAGERVFLLQLLLVVLALVRRPTYRDAVPAAVFVAAALLGQRNIVVASIVLVPLLARAAPELGSLRADLRDGAARIVLVFAVVVGVGATAVQLREADYDLESYPVESLVHLGEQEIDLAEVRMAAPEQVGNLLELRDGPRRQVFFDDRFDMFPDEVIDDALVLHQGRRGIDDVLDRWDIDLVLWPSGEPLTQVLGVDDAWHVLHEEERFTLLCRVGADLGGRAGTCA